MLHGGWRSLCRVVVLGLYWGNIGIMEKKMETTIVLQAYIGVYWDNGRENANYYNGLVIILGLHNIGVQYWGYIGIMQRNMGTTIVCVLIDSASGRRQWF